MKERGFTLIELLVVFAIIGILGSIAVVGTSGARDKAKKAVVLEQMEGVHAAVTKCLFDRKAMFCRGNSLSILGMAVGEWNCDDVGQNGGELNIYSTPAANWTGASVPFFEANSALCGEVDTTPENPLTGRDVEDGEYGFWPDITRQGFRYAPRADSNYEQGMFAFYVVEDVSDPLDDRTVICCTQTGCEMSERASADMAFLDGDIRWPMADFCLEQAGFTPDTDGVLEGD